MFRKEVRTIICPSCGRLTREDAAECLICGRRRPGLWGLTSLFRSVFRSGSVTSVVTVVCIAVYVASLIFDPRGALRPRGLLGFLPIGDTAAALFAAGAIPWLQGRWWTLLTAIYLHGNLLHILFNVLWIRQLGPAIEQLYGPARFITIFTVAGVTGFVASSLLGHAYTLGASGSIFGLLGALVAFGQRRGGVFGKAVLREYGMFAVILFVMAFVMPGVDHFAHAGGFVGGLGAGYVLSFADRRGETTLDHLLAGVAVVLTVIAFALALWSGFGW
ncbi:MAG: rhomboid family intramembrane serine protease [Candidatus Rokuibacteriota bacterium]